VGTIRREHPRIDGSIQTPGHSIAAPTEATGKTKENEIMTPTTLAPMTSVVEPFTHGRALSHRQRRLATTGTDHESHDSHRDGKSSER
jgi:hypothetical protein